MFLKVFGGSELQKPIEKKVHTIGLPGGDPLSLRGNNLEYTYSVLIGHISQLTRKSETRILI